MDDKQEIRILDACCGSRMFWWDKTEPHTTFMDIRQENRDITNGSVTKHVTVNPDVIADFRHMPFPDNHFDLVVFDPPHLIWAGPKSFMKAQYGQLPADWRSYMKDGFDECLRVLKNTGILLFKWSQAQIPWPTSWPSSAAPHPRRQARLNPLGSLPQTTQPPRRHGIPARNPPRRNPNTSVR